ncbi:doublecortin domain-containing protein 2-like [Oscarella lobularis]|uniref:doublecortin domain-containing protein 2-like n=1 Tax=Oscarella lobularis TaxID=121494 RepID=UPI0033138F86
METNPPTAKSVKICRNGDFNYVARRFVVNDRQARNFDAFLTQVTSGLRPPFGAVRRLYTPAHGHRVERLDDLRSGRVYVAGGTEKFKKSTTIRQGGKVKEVGYEMIGQQYRKSHTTEDLLTKARRIPVIVSARLHRFDKTPIQIHVFRNGDEIFKGIKFVLSKRDMQNWDLLMGMITEKIQLRTGAVRKLCTLEGLPVEKVENGRKYVAVGSDKFKRLPYGNELISTSPPQNRSFNKPRQRLPLKRASTWKKPRVIAEKSPEKSPVRAPKARPVGTKHKKGSSKKEVQPAPRKPSPVLDADDINHISDVASSLSSLRSAKEREGVFHASEVGGTSTEDEKEMLPEKTGDDIFTAGKVETVEAVEESKDTVVDKPVDMMEADVVEEEEVEGKENVEGKREENDSGKKRPTTWNGSRGRSGMASNESERKSRSRSRGDDEEREAVAADDDNKTEEVIGGDEVEEEEVVAAVEPLAHDDNEKETEEEIQEERTDDDNEEVREDDHGENVGKAEEEEIQIDGEEIREDENIRKEEEEEESKGQGEENIDESIERAKEEDGEASADEPAPPSRVSIKNEEGTE